MSRRFATRANHPVCQKPYAYPFNKASLFPRATTYEADIKRSRCPPSDTIKQHLGFTLNAQRTRDIVSGAER
jgi:hypothetical protein